MASFNQVVLLGNCTRDIELKTIKSGKSVAEIGLAVNERRKDASGNWTDHAHFFDVVCWGRTAEIAAEYLSKGSPVLIAGRLQQDRWEKDGQKHSKVKVMCETLQLLGGGTGGGKGGGGGGRQSGDESSEYSNPVGGAVAQGGDMDEVPF